MTEAALNSAVATAYIAFVEDATAKARVALTERDLGIMELAFSVGSDRAIAAILRDGNCRFEKE
jgi:hypothetical protein